MREKVRLKSKSSGYCYYTMKNKRTHPEKMTVKKFDPIVRAHCDFVETKLK